MALKDIGKGIKSLIDNINNLRVYAPHELEDSLELPCALILLGPEDYATTYDEEDYDCVFRIVICLAKQDTPSAYNDIFDYIEVKGTRSVFARLNEDVTLNGTCSASKCHRREGIGAIPWGGIMYLSTEFELLVWS